MSKFNIKKSVFQYTKDFLEDNYIVALMNIKSVIEYDTLDQLRFKTFKKEDDLICVIREKYEALMGLKLEDTFLEGELTSYRSRL